ncbi:arad-like aldolase/epimerase [Aureobasidium subglaciale]|nr:arad-like aldolase/epimerase [Aureobasidium subglaciale]KAI5216423.1 arad-like aldolase/epimerase [Aureobasidium subglaciale]KAI5219654.1 arad-like aldolase/epimerase [Aureobasidium subglaciale]KAI5257627.1 arad-like aldolase/epimerase [Aureobasidium subglaciale]
MSPIATEATNAVSQPVPKSAKPLTPLELMGHGGIAVQAIPKFDSYAAKRQWTLEHLAGAFRVFGREGYAEGIAGHISVRDPEHSDRFWINPLAVHFSMMKVSDLICLDMQGNVVGGNKSVPANAAGVSIHTACHLARPDAHAICHAHSLYGKAWATFGRELDMISQDVCYFYKAHSVYRNYGGIAFESDEGTAIAHALGSNKAAILVNHGLITVGVTVDEAAYLYTLLEKSCRIQLMVESTGLPKMMVPDEEAADTFRLASQPPWQDTLFVEFQPSYKLEEHLNPDFKD